MEILVEIQSERKGKMVRNEKEVVRRGDRDREFGRDTE